jgi:hypothetical protein
MKGEKMIKVKGVLILTVIMSTIILVFVEGVSAGPQAARFCIKKADIVGNYHHVIRIPPRPPGWPQMWLARDVIRSFNENGIRIKNTNNEQVMELLPAHTNEIIKFSVKLNERNLKGCVLEFENKKDFDAVKEHYLDLNSKHQLHSWSLMKDNILVVIDGSMPEQDIRKYKAVLAGME